MYWKRLLCAGKMKFYVRTPWIYGIWRVWAVECSCAHLHPGARLKWAVSFMLRALYHRADHRPVPTEYEALWSTEPIWTFDKKSLSAGWNLTFVVQSMLSYRRDWATRRNYLGRVHPIVHKYTTVFICICRLNTAFFNDIIGDRFQSYKTTLRPCTLLKTSEWRV